MNVSSVKNLNGESFSAVQDLELTNFVQTNSGSWTGVEFPASANEAITAYQNNSATYLTSHQDLSDYQTIAGMTAYQEAGNYYSASNPSGFITGVDLTPYYTTAEANSLSSMLSASIDYVSANAGDEFPISADEAIQYVQTNSGTIDDTVTSYQTNSGDYLKESELGYNAVDEVSAINGSAIAQYGAEKQWLVHDDTLVHASNSAQYALGVNLSAVAQLLGVDETILYENSVGIADSASTAQLSEPIENFKFVDFYMQGMYRPNPIVNRFLVGTASQSYRNDVISVDGGSTYNWVTNITSNNTTLGFGRSVMFTQTWTGSNRAVSNPTQCGLIKVVGIGRKS